MNWDKFLQDVKPFKNEYISDPGKKLFGLILHDSLACLNEFKVCIKLIEDQPDAPQKLKNWFSKWNSKVTKWIEKLTDLWKYEKEDVVSSYDWADHVRKVDQILSDVCILAKEARNILYDRVDLYDNENVLLILKTAIYNINCINTLITNIHAKEFLLLWNRNHKQKK